MTTTQRLAGFCLDCQQQVTLERDANRLRAPWQCASCGSTSVTAAATEGVIDGRTVASPQPWPAAGTDPIRRYMQGPAWLILAAACALVASAFLPWMQAQSGIFNVSRNGIENGATDGWYGVFVGTILGIWEVAHLSRHAGTGLAVPIFQGLLAVGGAAVAVWDIQDIGRRAELLNANAYSTASVGPGVYLMLVACAVVLAGCFWRTRTRC